MTLLTKIADKFDDFILSSNEADSLDEISKKKIKTRVTIVAIILGIFLAPTYFYALGIAFNVKPNDHFSFLIGGDPYEEQHNLLKKHLDEVNEKVNEYEQLALKRQKVLWSLLEETFDSNDIALVKALKLVNRSQDIINKLVELGKIYYLLVNEDKLTKDTQEALVLMYEGYFYVLNSEFSKFDIEKANEKYNIVYNKYLNDFPSPIDDEVKIEVLNVLTYSNFIMGFPERGKHFLSEAKILLDEYLKSGNFSPVEYRRKYYWIDFANFTNAISHYKKREADKIFTNMKSRLNEHDFLRIKLRQHLTIDIKEDQRKAVESYIEKTFY
ncbi:MAG: hypothetical protein QNK40_14705 [Desulfobacterales bacterium]|nr:hypothetical protein [Desulfobacterales bacterium]